jgi:hypothetical protein
MCLIIMDLCLLVLLHLQGFSELAYIGRLQFLRAVPLLKIGLASLDRLR